MILGLAAACWPPPAAAQVAFGIAGAADPPAVQSKADCLGIIFATIEDTNAVLVRVVDLEGPFTGTITAYGSNRMWTGRIERATLVDLPYGGHEASVIVRADGPIEGIEYAPAWGACTFHVGPISRNYYEAGRMSRPTLVLNDPQPASPVSCAHPYVSPAVTQAVEPQTPSNADAEGTVRIGVALDARGRVRSARVLSSPSATLNPSAVAAATRSEFTGAIFRCVAVPSAYPFGIGYNI
ncbi:MAG TPA: TonB family protein [Candidatus Elarobacter sp.]|nr:TonB family protein [Candidatus Elarobacter sp.]